MNRLKEVRKNNNETQFSLSKFLNVAQNTISNWETGRTEIDQENLNKLSRHYNVSLDNLIGDTLRKPSGVVLTAFESDVVGELRRLSKIDKQNLARIIFSYTQNYALVEKYKTYNSAFETAVSD